MRDDIMKKICERGKRGKVSAATQKQQRAARRKLARGDMENLPKREGIRSKKLLSQTSSYTKEFDDFLAPLQRYLERQVGRRWNDVHAEISQGIDRRKVTGQHVFDHIKYMVQTKVVEKDGQLWAMRDTGGPHLLSNSSVSLYVDPDGFLRKKPESGRRRFSRHQRTPKLPLVRSPRRELPNIGRYYEGKFSGNWYFVKYENVWYECFLARPLKYTTTEERSSKYMAGATTFKVTDTAYYILPEKLLPSEKWDMVKPFWRHQEGKSLSRYQAYGRDVFAVCKRQLNSREIKKHQLNKGE
tara:strand:+ start:3049 stop:3945 length:897 start_codon:yes stop_codon:yes gene_type:complete